MPAPFGTTVLIFDQTPQVGSSSEQFRVPALGTCSDSTVSNVVPLQVEADRTPPWYVEHELHQ